MDETNSAPIWNAQTVVYREGLCGSQGQIVRVMVYVSFHPFLSSPFPPLSLSFLPFSLSFLFFPFPPPYPIFTAIVFRLCNYKDQMLVLYGACISLSLCSSSSSYPSPSPSLSCSPCSPSAPPHISYCSSFMDRSLHNACDSQGKIDMIQPPLFPLPTLPHYF